MVVVVTLGYVEGVLGATNYLGCHYKAALMSRDSLHLNKVTG